MPGTGWPPTCAAGPAPRSSATRSWRPRPAPQVGRALDSLGHGDGAEIHLVLSVRDLVRQIPAEWQENVKHRSVISYARFLEQIRDPARESRIATWFWGVQEVPDILDRWGARPAPGAGPPGHGAAARRAAGPAVAAVRAAFGLDGLDLDLEAERANPSLGVPETALRAPDQPLGQPRCSSPPTTGRWSASCWPTRRSRSAPGSPRLALPPDVHPWAQQVEASWIEEIEKRGYDVVGDLADLVGPRPAAGRTRTGRRRSRWPAPRSTRSGRCCWRTRGCGTPRSGSPTSCARPRWRSSAPTCARRTGCARRSCGDSQESRTGRGLLKGYRRARGRSSLSA